MSDKTVGMVNDRVLRVECDFGKVEDVRRYPTQGAWARALIECGGLEPPVMGVVAEGEKQ